MNEIRQAISNAGVHWEAGENAVTKLTSIERSMKLGLAEGGRISLKQKEEVAKAKLTAFLTYGAAAAYPPAYDLRNVGGQNFITSVTDQGGCGSCVAFGAVATVEGTFRRQRNDPNLAVDLSEAQLFYCYARSEGANCATGWGPDSALNAFRDKGVADEACYPYTAGDQNCSNLCADWQNRAIKITGWHSINTTTTDHMKEWISTRGPLCACFTVYNDFFSYNGGIYKHVTGGVAGGHCVCCVGYNDAEKYWICKNSWGTGWGESGFFKIAYGDCGIDSGMDAVDGIAETGWERDKRIVGLWAINEDRNAWAYVQNLGWRKISPDNDNIFLDMLTQLASAKAGNRRVDFRQENAVIKEAYVF